MTKAQAAVLTGQLTAALARCERLDRDYCAARASAQSEARGFLERQDQYKREVESLKSELAYAQDKVRRCNESIARLECTVEGALRAATAFANGLTRTAD